MRSTCSAVRISSGAQRLVSRGRGASEGPVERWARPRSRRREVAGTSVMAWPLSNSSAVVRLTAVRDDYPIGEPQLQFVVRSVGMTWELARRLGPYLMLEILLPGGTLFALLLFLYRRRSAPAAQHLISHRDFRNSTIAC